MNSTASAWPFIASGIDPSTNASTGALEVLHPGLLLLELLRAEEPEQREHVERVIGSDQPAFRAEVGQQELGVPPGAGQRLDHRHARRDAEELERFPGVTPGVPRLDLFGLRRQDGGHSIGIGPAGEGRPGQDERQQQEGLDEILHSGASVRRL
jgi:hypothetical protein